MSPIRSSTKLVSLAAIAAFALALAPTPAKAADLCLQFDGVSCLLSEDIGFFRFFGAKLPTSTKKATALHGRNAGLYAATGTAVQTRLGTGIDLMITFEYEGDPNLAQAFIVLPASLAVGQTFPGAGTAGQGSFTLGGTCDLTIADCATEP